MQYLNMCVVLHLIIFSIANAVEIFLNCAGMTDSVDIIING